MALTVYTSKNNQWREYVNPMRGLTLERMANRRRTFNAERPTSTVQVRTRRCRLLTILTESGSGTLTGSAHQEAFNQVAKADSVMVSEALRRDFDTPLLEAAFPGWPVEAGFELRMEEFARVKRLNV